MSQQAEESERLCEAVGRLGTADWPAVSAAMGERFTPESCRSAWRGMLREARIARGDVMSPCNKVCKLDKESSTYCYVGADTTDAAHHCSVSSVFQLNFCRPKRFHWFCWRWTRAQGCFRDMDAIAGWNSFDKAQKQAALESAAKRKEEHERLYARAARAIDSAASVANKPPTKVVSSKHPEK